jgi:hypothetical protein
VVGDAGSLVEALDLDSSLSDQERQEVVIHAIVQNGLPWLEARDTEAKARSALLADKAATGLVMATARRHLGIVDPV